MGQKVNPTSLRLGITSNWHSDWYSDTNAQQLLHEDIQIQSYLRSIYDRHGYIAGTAKIQRSLSEIKVNLPVAEPLDFMGDKGARKRSLASISVENIGKVLEKITGLQAALSIETFEQYNSAHLLARDLAQKMESRMPFATLLKKATKYVITSNEVKGVKIQCSGRLNGEDIARTEWVKEGEIPLHTISAKIDYGFSSGYTMYGVTGVKVWICRK